MSLDTGASTPPLRGLFDSRYTIQGEIGKGSMGTIYRAFDSRLERVVAIKTIRLDLNQDTTGERQRRFEREARASGRMNHPAIVTIYDSGVADEVAYISMELLDGTTIDRLVEHGERLDSAAIVEFMLPIAEALDYAHSQGVVHRDVKPGNIVRLANGATKLTDFGIAQFADTSFTQTGIVLGTPKYIAPEQISGQPVDGRADIFSFGVVLYELLTGRAPFIAPTLVGMMHTVLHTSPDLPTLWSPDLPSGLVSILARCLAKAPEERYASAAELVRDLRAYKTLATDEARIRRTFDGIPGTALPTPIDPAYAQTIDTNPSLAAGILGGHAGSARASHSGRLANMLVAALVVGGVYAVARLASPAPESVATPTGAAPAVAAPSVGSTTAGLPAAAPLANLPGASGETVAQPEPVAPVRVHEAPRVTHPHPAAAPASHSVTASERQSNQELPDGSTPPLSDRAHTETANAQNQPQVIERSRTESTVHVPGMFERTTDQVAGFFKHQRDCLVYDKCQSTAANPQSGAAAQNPTQKSTPQTSP